MTTRDFDVVIVGAGPAGLAAAEIAALGKQRVALIDENPQIGGQIWRSCQGKLALHAKVHHGLLTKETAHASKVTIIPNATIFDAPARNQLLAQTPTGPTRIHYKDLILATGARELFLPFPGWTLPNVCGAGGLQALVKSGLDIKGKRVVVSGSGPLILEVARYLLSKGADVLMVAEQTRRSRFFKFASTTAMHPAKAYQGLKILAKTGALLRFDSWVTAAHGDQKLQGVTVRTSRGEQRIDCDYLACAYGLVPNTELPRLLGCEMNGDFVRADKNQQTSIPNVYAAGELTGIGGTDASLVEGRIAGAATTGMRHLPETYFRKRRTTQRFTQALEEAFRIRPEILRLATDETIVCRCEDVTLAQLRYQPTLRDAKLQTRCTMGPCQGRICAPAMQHLFDWPSDSIRPPISPVPLESLLDSN